MPIKERLTAIEKQRIVAGLTNGLLIKVLATEMKGISELWLQSLRISTSGPGKIRAQEAPFLLRIFEKFVEVVRNRSSTSAFIFCKG